MRKTALGIVLALASCRPEPPSKARPGAEREPAPTRADEPAPTLVEQPEPEPAPPEPELGVADLGVFSDLDEQVQISLPPKLEPSTTLALLDEGRALLLLYAEGRPIKAYPLETEAEAEADARPLTFGDRSLALRPGDHGELAPLLVDPAQLRVLAPGTTAPPGDRDRDGLPDPLDLELGAIKTTLNAAAYNQDYFELPYPGGDVERGLGACTDVIVRALRNAGVDLQVELHEDIDRAPRRYPMVKTANASIDHRRVRTLLPWFRAHWLALDEHAPLVAGDVVFMDTIESRSGPDHIGILGDRRAEDGRPLVANNWTDGYRTAFMDLLEVVEISDRFRMPPAPEHAGPIPAFARQALVVRSSSWSSFHAQARRFARATVNGPWEPVGEAFPVVLGHAGLGWGRGLHGEGIPAALAGSTASGPRKREGDGRSPAGVFEIGEAYGRAPGPEAGARLKLPYHEQPASLRCVDDPASRHYATIVDAEAVTLDWSSAEPMRRLYALAITVEHNRERAPEGGSCIFLHAWDGPDSPVTGCTAMAADALATLAGWLEPGAVLVALPAPLYGRLSEPWSLPRFDADGG